MINTANSLSQQETDVNRLNLVIAAVAMVTVEHSVGHYYLHQRQINGFKVQTSYILHHINSLTRPEI